MPPSGPGVVVFEGGGAPADELTPVEADLRSVRDAVALDTLAVLGELRRGHEVGAVVLVTDRRGLAAEASRLGVEVRTGPADFHFGICLRALVTERRWREVIVLGGSAGPLLRRADWASVAGLLRAGDGVAVMNNPQSPDIVGFKPARILLDLAPPASDNELGQALLRAGLRRVLMASSPRASFDLDTPTDCAILAGEPEAGPRARAALDACAWIGPLRARIDAVAAVMGREMGELALIGRVGPPVTAHVNELLRCRLRVFSEERGMRALGREREGLVVSFLGLLLEDIGPERFFARLGDVADAALFDTRVLMAQWRRPLPDRDRFHSDVGDVDAVADPLLRRFTAAAMAAPLPVVLGGHALVHGGLWLLCERVASSIAAWGTGGGSA